jgi:hypothetical protein
MHPTNIYVQTMRYLYVYTIYGLHCVKKNKWGTYSICSKKVVCKSTDNVRCTKIYKICIVNLYILCICIVVSCTKMQYTGVHTIVIVHCTLCAVQDTREKRDLERKCRENIDILVKVVRCVHSRPASAVDTVLRSVAVQNLLGWLACSVHNGPPSPKFQILPSQLRQRADRAASLSVKGLWCTSSQLSKYCCGEVPCSIQKGPASKRQNISSLKYIDYITLLI